MKKEDEIVCTALANAEAPQNEQEPFQWEVGKHYQGSFWINEFGEIQVRASQKGTKPGNMKIVTSGANHVIYASKKLVRLVITLPRLDGKALRAFFTSVVTLAIIDLMKYDFSKETIKKIQ